jgi:hypothetical protein
MMGCKSDMNLENKKCIQSFVCERQRRWMDNIKINFMEEVLSGNMNFKKSQCRVKFSDLVISSHLH